MRDTYVVLIPGARGNPTDTYLVVTASEWVAVDHGEKDSYDFANEHDDYPSASAERDWLNIPGQEPLPAEEAVPVPVGAESA
jgi:hypothetical protein